jgi:hypothetical protein
MNISKLSDNIDAIELLIKKFTDRELTYTETCDKLNELGHSKNDAQSILDKIAGTFKNGLNR